MADEYGLLMNTVKQSNELTFFRESTRRSYQTLLVLTRLTELYLKNTIAGQNVLPEQEQLIINELDAEATQNLVYEVVISRLVDAFDHYLSQILLRIFTNRTEIFKASEYKAEVREFIEAGSLQEFIVRFAEKKVNELSYQGLPKIIEYLNKKLGLKFDTSTPEFQSACELIEVRNIVVHNAGYVSKMYLQRTGRTDFHEGDLYPITRDYITEKPGVFSKFVISLDSQIISHFNLIENE